MNKKDLTTWMKSGEYLPPPLRDFHDQKDLFKTIHDTYDLSNNPYCKDIPWISGQCYVIDIFLWFMAKHGWTLQRSRQKIEFRDLYDDVQAAQEKSLEGFKNILDAEKNKNDG